MAILLDYNVHSRTTHFALVCLFPFFFMWSLFLWMATSATPSLSQENGMLCLPEHVHLPQLLPDWSYLPNISYFHHFSTQFFLPTWIPFSLVQIPISSHLDYCSFYVINLFPDWPVFLQLYPTNDNLVHIFLVELVWFLKLYWSLDWKSLYNFNSVKMPAVEYQLKACASLISLTWEAMVLFTKLCGFIIILFYLEV